MKHILATITACLVLVVALMGFSISALSGRAAALTSQEAVCQGAGAASTPDTNSTSTGCQSSGTDINGILKFALNILSIIVGIVAVIMIIIAGLKFITSNGEASNVASAKNTILYAVVGIIIVALAQIIVQFVLKKTHDAVTPPTTFIHLVEKSKAFMV